MPEVIQGFLEKNNDIEALQKARKIQLNLLEGYKSDFSKYS